MYFQTVSLLVREAMTVDEFLTAASTKLGLSAVEHFVRVKKRKDMPNVKCFVPHRGDLIETYVSERLSFLLRLFACRLALLPLLSKAYTHANGVVAIILFCAPLGPTQTFPSFAVEIFPEAPFSGSLPSLAMSASNCL